MPTPLNPPVSANFPVESKLTSYDREHLIVYLRLLDAEKDGADWREVARIVLQLDPDHDVESAHTIWRRHLDRAHWMTRSGYKHLLKDCPDS